MFKYIHIIGSGAIGSLLAANAQRHRLTTIRHVRSKPVETVTLLNKQQVVLDTLQNCWPQSSLGENMVIVPLKSYQILHAITEYVDAFPQKCAIVLLNNGMGCYQQVAERLSAHTVYLATTSQGAYKPSEIECIHSGEGKTMIGAVGNNHDKSQKEAVMNCFGMLLSSVYWQQDIDLALWKKLAVNALINPVTAIENIPNGKLLDGQYVGLLGKLAQELADVAHAESISLDQDEIVATSIEVIKQTANNYSSMHQDVKFNRRTEIDAINGFVLECAKKHEIKCPNHQAVFDQVNGLVTPTSKTD